MFLLFKFLLSFCPTPGRDVRNFPAVNAGKEESTSHSQILYFLGRSSTSSGAELSMDMRQKVASAMGLPEDSCCSSLGGETIAEVHECW